MPTFDYGSGRLIGHPAVTAIFADVPVAGLVGWNDPSQAGLKRDDVCFIVDFLSDLVDSAFMDAIGAEYSTSGTTIGRGTFSTPAFAVMAPAIQPAAPPVEVTDADVQAFLRTLISTNVVPPVAVDSCYFIFLPPEVTSVSQFGRSDSLFEAVVGYHSAFLMPNGDHVYYAVIPFDSTIPSASVSHELAEMVTNPEGNGWTTQTQMGYKIIKQEIADICDEPASFHGHYITQFWSRSRGACFAPSDDGLEKKTQVSIVAIQGVTCLGHAIDDGQPLTLSLRVEHAGNAENIVSYTWFAIDNAQPAGVNNIATFRVIPTPGARSIAVSVVATSDVGCQFQAQRTFMVFSEVDARREEALCALLQRLRTVATIVLFPRPLWDPLRDLVVHPPTDRDIRALEEMATDLGRLAAELKRFTPLRSARLTPSSEER